jgi:hypothetical protein
MAQQTTQHHTVYLQWDRHGHYVGKLSAPADEIPEWRRRVTANGGYTVEAGAAGTPWTCACAFINFDGSESCGGCHLTRSPAATLDILAACTAFGVAAFHDAEDNVIYAHPSHVSQDRALDGRHVMIQWDEAQAARDRTRLSATAWSPNGRPDFHQADTLYTTPAPGPLADEAQHCARAVAQWMTDPDRTAGTLLLAAFAEHGIVPGEALTLVESVHSDSYDLSVQLDRWTYGRLSVADRDGSVRHIPAAHTGWSILLHDERGDTVGNPVYITGNDGLVDCAKDSAAAAAYVAALVKNPVLRHCDCYQRERHNPRHDHECHLYAIPRVIRQVG